MMRIGDLRAFAVCAAILLLASCGDEQQTSEPATSDEQSASTSSTVTSTPAPTVSPPTGTPEPPPIVFHYVRQGPAESGDGTFVAFRIDGLDVAALPLGSVESMLTWASPLDVTEYQVDSAHNEFTLRLAPGTAGGVYEATFRLEDGREASVTFTLDETPALASALPTVAPMPDAPTTTSTTTPAPMATQVPTSTPTPSGQGPHITPTVTTGIGLLPLDGITNGWVFIQQFFSVVLSAAKSAGVSNAVDGYWLQPSQGQEIVQTLRSNLFVGSTATGSAPLCTMFIQLDGGAPQSGVTVRAGVNDRDCVGGTLTTMEFDVGARYMDGRWWLTDAAVVSVTPPATPTSPPSADALASLPAFAVYEAQLGVCNWVFARLPGSAFESGTGATGRLVRGNYSQTLGKGGEFLDFGAAANAGIGVTDGVPAGTAPAACDPAEREWVATYVGTGPTVLFETMIRNQVSFINETILDATAAASGVVLTPETKAALLGN